MVWTGRHRAGLAMVGNKVLAGMDPGTVIAFGAGFRTRRSQPGQEFGPCPVAGIIRSLARRSRVIMVDEYNTSQRCSQQTAAGPVCGGQLIFSEREGKCTMCGEAMDRDRNAARNIRAVAVQMAHNGTRPLALRPAVVRIASPVNRY